jgi:hypothetical protein
MSSNEQQTGDQDVERIDVDDADAVRRWAQKFNATPEQISEAVGAVGDKAPDVEMHLNGSRSTTNSERVAAEGG